jgi:hypothetical protein
VGYWDFSKSATGGWNSIGSKSFFLQFGSEEVSQVLDTVLNRSVAEFQDGQWLEIPREKLGKLNIHGKQASLTVLALVKKQSDKNWQAIAGVWDESRSKRQYYLFLNASSKTHQDDMKRYPSKGRLHAHISALGGKTLGEVAWITYASSAQSVPVQTWTWIAMTYDGKSIMVFVNGKLQSDSLTNPFFYPEGIFDGEENGADFTVGSNSVGGKMTNQFLGRMAFLAVFDKSLSEKDIQNIQNDFHVIPTK